MTREQFIEKIRNINEELSELRRCAPDITEAAGIEPDEELYEALWNTCERISHSADVLRQQSCYVEHSW